MPLTISIGDAKVKGVLNVEYEIEGRLIDPLTLVEEGTEVQ